MVESSEEAEVKIRGSDQEVFITGSTRWRMGANERDQSVSSVVVKQAGQERHLSCWAGWIEQSWARANLELLTGPNAMEEENQE